MNGASAKTVWNGGDVTTSLVTMHTQYQCYVLSFDGDWRGGWVRMLESLDAAMGAGMWSLERIRALGQKLSRMGMESKAWRSD
jgi:hypothetical protein